MFSLGEFAISVPRPYYLHIQYTVCVHPINGGEPIPFNSGPGPICKLPPIAYRFTVVSDLSKAGHNEKAQVVDPKTSWIVPLGFGSGAVASLIDGSPPSTALFNIPFDGIQDVIAHIAEPLL